MPKPIAIWSRALGIWEVPETENLLCEHSDVFSETWPTSGSMRNGRVFVPLTSEPRTSGTASSSLPGRVTTLPTPRVSDANGGGSTVTEDSISGRPSQLFRTPTAQLAVNGGSQHPDKHKAGGHGPTLADEVEHLLT